MLISHGGVVKYITLYSLAKPPMELEEALQFNDSASDEEMVWPMCMINQLNNFQECSEESQLIFLSNSSSYGYNNHPFKQILKSDMQAKNNSTFFSSLCNATEGASQEIEPFCISIEVSPDQFFHISVELTNEQRNKLMNILQEQMKAFT